MKLKELVVSQPSVFVKQRYEIAELMGFESRNKYEVLDSQGQVLGFVAEQQRGVLGFLLRQFLGHWRSFTLNFFDPERGLSFVANHPFRFFFQRLEMQDAHGRPLGVLQQRFAILKRKFDLQDAHGRVIMQMEAGLFHFWTFPVFKNSREVAAIKKRWSGSIAELLTDRDSFLVDYKDPSLTSDEKLLLLASAVFIDLNYFEKKA